MEIKTNTQDKAIVTNTKSSLNQRKHKNYALLIALLSMIAIVYIVTLIKLFKY